MWRGSALRCRYNSERTTAKGRDAYQSSKTLRPGPLVPEGVTLDDTTAAVLGARQRAMPAGCAGGARLPLAADAGVLPCDGVAVLACAASAAVEAAMSAERRIEAWAPIVLDALAARYGSRPATAQKAAAEADRLVRYLRARGAATVDDITEDLIVGWCWTARPDRSGRYRKVSAGTAKVRRWAARAWLGTLEMLGAGIDAAALAGPAVGDALPSWSSRPLTEAEAALVRGRADAGLWFSSRSVVVALAFAGGTAAEIASTAAADVDVAAGTVRFAGRAARTNPLDDWGREAISRHLASRAEQPARRERLCVDGSLPIERASHSVTVRVRQAVIDAGLGAVPEITARSVRLSGALRVAEQHGIFAAAEFLGNASLDRTAAALRWHPDRDRSGQDRTGG